MIELPLQRGLVTLIDDQDAELVDQYRWHALIERRHLRTVYYVSAHVQGSKGSRTTLLMHRLLLGQGFRYIDHINGDGLDNRRDNLRPATNSQNLQNGRSRPGTSRFKGVAWRRDRAMWSAQIRIEGRPTHLGFFVEEEHAANAHDEAARKAYGEFAALNFPRPGEQSALHQLAGSHR